MNEICSQIWVLWVHLSLAPGFWYEHNSSIERNKIGMTQKREQPRRQHVPFTFTVTNYSLPDRRTPRSNTIPHNFNTIEENFQTICNVFKQTKK